MANNIPKIGRLLKGRISPTRWRRGLVNSRAPIIAIESLGGERELIAIAEAQVDWRPFALDFGDGEEAIVMLEREEGERRAAAGEIMLTPGVLAAGIGAELVGGAIVMLFRRGGFREWDWARWREWLDANAETTLNAMLDDASVVVAGAMQLDSNIPRAIDGVGWMMDWILENNRDFISANAKPYTGKRQEAFMRSMDAAVEAAGSAAHSA